MLTMILAQTPVPSPGDDPWPWVATLAVAALGFLFKRYDDAKDQRIARSEKREDSYLETTTTTTSILKEQSAATLKAAEIAEQAFEMGKMTHDLLASSITGNEKRHQENLERIDRNNAQIGEILRRLDTATKDQPSSPAQR